MNKTYSLPKVVRTWALLFSVPLYVGTSALWLKEEIKDVVSEKEENVMTAIEQHMEKAFADKSQKKSTVTLP
ncbi:hypothetical protein [Rufibacter immobilis]|nr:hypothetical protein [Rufibacter immobilis]